MTLFPGATLRQLVEWGFPMGVKRPTPPADQAWSVVHITGNSRLPSAENEAAWRINDPATQNSASFFVNRDGSIVQTLGDPLHMDPYANGDWNRPDLSNPRIAAWYARRAYYNANELTLVAIENVGYEPGASITPAQETANARIIAFYHGLAGVPVNRQTVIGHYQLNSVTRPNCPGVSKAVIDRIVAKASAFLPNTATPEEEDDMSTAWIRDIVPLRPMQVITTKPGAVFRFWPAYSNVDNEYARIEEPTDITAIGTVEGEEFQGSSLYYVYVVNRGLRVMHSGHVAEMKSYAFAQEAQTRQALQLAGTIRNSAIDELTKAQTGMADIAKGTAAAITRIKAI